MFRTGQIQSVPAQRNNAMGFYDVLDQVLDLLRQRERVVPNEELLGTLWYGVAVTEASLLKAIRIARKT